MRWIIVLIVLIVLGALSALAGWLAGEPGTLTINWLDYRVDTNFAVLLVVVVVFTIVVAVIYRGWRSLRRGPGAFARFREGSRRRRGYEALSRGMVAVAAGDVDTARRQARRAESLRDVDTARRQARRAESLLRDPPLTMLLSAQAAQLDDDEKAAAGFFTAMLDRRETEFLGVRGLLTQALKREDWDEALQLAKRAHRLSPKSEWVVNTLYDLQKRTGEWSGAEITLKQSEKLKLLPASNARRERAELHFNMSLANKGPEAIKYARKAQSEDPTFVPPVVRHAEILVPVVRHAEILVEMGRHRRAGSVIESAWERAPDPDLAEVYWSARKVEDAVQKVQAAQRLARHNPNHIESRMAVAVAALEARLWGEARAQLEPIATEDAPPRVCRLMAELEEAEHGDLARARMWLMRAAGDAYAPEMSSPVPQAAIAAD